MRSLQEYREEEHFDIPEVARKADIQEDRLIRMLIGVPVTQGEAEKVLEVLGVRDVYINSFVPCPLPPKPPTPTFHELRVKHNLTLEAFAKDTGLNVCTVRLLDKYNEASPAAFNVIVCSLARLSGIPYSKKTVRTATFVLMPNLSKVM